MTLSGTLCCCSEWLDPDFEPWCCFDRFSYCPPAMRSSESKSLSRYEPTMSKYFHDSCSTSSLESPNSDDPNERLVRLFPRTKGEINPISWICLAFRWIEAMQAYLHLGEWFRLVALRRRLDDGELAADVLEFSVRKILLVSLLIDYRSH